MIRFCSKCRQPNKKLHRLIRGCSKCRQVWQHWGWFWHQQHPWEKWKWAAGCGSCCALNLVRKFHRFVSKFLSKFWAGQLLLSILWENFPDFFLIYAKFSSSLRKWVGHQQLLSYKFHQHSTWGKSAQKKYSTSDQQKDSKIQITALMLRGGASSNLQIATVGKLKFKELRSSKYISSSSLILHIASVGKF